TYSQCTVNPPSTNEGVYPDTISDACLNSYYSDVVQIVFPLDTMVTIAPFGTFTIPYDSVRIDSVVLPAGLSYSCGTPNCYAYSVTPGTPISNCLFISGIPTSAVTDFQAVIYL